MSTPIACGSRQAYRRGCRCLPCRAAQSSYRRQLARRPPCVSAAEAQARLTELRAAGIGITQVARLSQIPHTTLQDVRSGARRTIPAPTLAAILAVPQTPADGARVLAWPTRRLLRWLLLEDFTRTALAQRLGLPCGRLQYRQRHCRVRTARRVRALYLRITAA